MFYQISCRTLTAWYSVRPAVQYAGAVYLVRSSVKLRWTVAVYSGLCDSSGLSDSKCCRSESACSNVAFLASLVRISCKRASIGYRSIKEVEYKMARELCPASMTSVEKMLEAVHVATRSHVPLHAMLRQKQTPAIASYSSSSCSNRIKSKLSGQLLTSVLSPKCVHKTFGQRQVGNSISEIHGYRFNYFTDFALLLDCSLRVGCCLTDLCNCHQHIRNDNQCW